MTVPMMYSTGVPSSFVPMPMMDDTASLDSTSASSGSALHYHMHPYAQPPLVAQSLSQNSSSTATTSAQDASTLAVAQGASNNNKSSKKKSAAKKKGPGGSTVAPNPLNQQCINCSTTTTPLWRRDESGQPICNACGLYYKLHNTHRPVSLKKTSLSRRRKRAQSSDEDDGPVPPRNSSRAMRHAPSSYDYSSSSASSMVPYPQSSQIRSHPTFTSDHPQLIALSLMSATVNAQFETRSSPVPPSVYTTHLESEILLMEDQITSNVASCLSSMRRTQSLPQAPVPPLVGYANTASDSQPELSGERQGSMMQAFPHSDLESMGSYPHTRLPSLQGMMPGSTSFSSSSFSSALSSSGNSTPSEWSSKQWEMMLESECSGLDPLMTLASVSVALSILH